VIGRNPDCTLAIHDKRLSGKHCEIVKFESKVTLTDLSTNGTYIGDKKVGKNKT
jgi:pSer/pThr/pTyr-binding forkhead associated (FHA) protein